jgi:hypothetical protein
MNQESFKFGDIQPVRQKTNEFSFQDKKERKNTKVSELEGIDDLLPIEVCCLVASYGGYRLLIARSSLSLLPAVN